MAHNVSALSPITVATRSTTIPLNASRTTVVMASFLANLGFSSLRTRKTLVAPMLPLPSFRISFPVKLFAKRSPKGIPPQDKR